MKIFLMSNKNSEEEFKAEIARRLASPLHYMSSADKADLIFVESPLNRGEAYGLFNRFKGKKLIFLIANTQSGVGISAFRGEEK